MSSPKLHCLRIATTALAAAAVQSPAFAHVGFHPQGIADGIVHPFSGLDHILAMLAVGLWVSQLGRPAWWLAPLTFSVVMGLGAALGVSGIALPWVEIGIATSVVVLGAAVALALIPPIAISLTLIAAFAVVHGYAHGIEPAASSSPLAYGLGFVAAAFVLQGLGLGLGALADRTTRIIVVRSAAATIALTGLVLLVRL